MKRLDIKRKLSARSDRVKCVDFHPTEPWILSSLYNGSVFIWNYQTKELVKSFEVTDQPIRTGKFISRKNWIIIGSDDMCLSVYNYNTLERVHKWEAHNDYIRSVAVHPTKPYILSSADDMLVKLWNWDQGWTCSQVFEGHSHYVMQVTFNPKDPNTFASASLDSTVKVWGLGSSVPHFTLEGHEKGINSVDYFAGGDKPYLVTGSDDFTVKVWDYINKKCIQTLEGHAHNVSVVAYHPSLPIILSGSEDGTVRIWQSSTYRLEKTLNYGMERVWTLGLLKGSNKVAIGYDDGTVMIRIGKEEPCMSMDRGGKLVWTKQLEVQQVNLKQLNPDDLTDGERITLATKDLGQCDSLPQRMEHNPKGNFVTVVADGEYTIYTALAWRTKAHGTGTAFVWGSDSKHYAVRETASKIALHKDFRPVDTLRPTFAVEGLFGGTLLAARSSTFVCFYDWVTGALVRRIDVVPKAVFWSNSGENVTIATDTNFFVLRYDAAAVRDALQSGQPAPDDGFEAAFTVEHEFSERVVSGTWIGDCFVYTSGSNRLCYCIGNEVVIVSHLDKRMYVLGYLAKLNRVFLADKQRNVTSYRMHVSTINYQTAVLRKDFAAAEQVLPTIPMEHRGRIAQFLEAQDLPELALQVATDPDHKFELALQLDRLRLAFELAAADDNAYKWKQLSDLALQQNDLALTERCMQKAGDLNGLLLLYAAQANADGIQGLADTAFGTGRHNVAFASLFLLGKVDECLALLCQAGRVPEAAFVARSYAPSRISKIMALWRSDLAKTNPKAAEALADPTDYPNLFPNLSHALAAEAQIRSGGKQPVAGDSGVGGDGGGGGADAVAGDPGSPSHGTAGGSSDADVPAVVVPDDAPHGGDDGGDGIDPGPPTVDVIADSDVAATDTVVADAPIADDPVADVPVADDLVADDLVADALAADIAADIDTFPQADALPGDDDPTALLQPSSPLVDATAMEPQESNLGDADAAEGDLLSWE